MQSIKITLLSLIISIASGCICLVQGELKVRKNHVYNKCGLLNGVRFCEIRVDSFQNNLPVRYEITRSSLLYKDGASPNKDPKRLYYNRDYSEVYLHQNGRVTDTIKGPLKFQAGTWYLLQDDDTEVFVFIDNSGKKQVITENKVKHNL